MSDWTSGLAVGVSALAMPLVVRLLTRNIRGSAGRDGEQYIVRYGRAWAVFLAAAGTLLVGGSTAILCFANLDAEGRSVCLAFEAIFVLIFGFGALDLAKVDHRVDEDGFERRTPWRRHVRVPWSQVVRVRYEPTARLMFKARSGDDVRLSVYLTGLGTVAALVLKHAGPEALDAATRRGLEELAQRKG